MNQTAEHDRQEAPVLSDGDCKFLSVLLWYERNHPEELTPEAWAELRTLEARARAVALHEMWSRIHEDQSRRIQAVMHHLAAENAAEKVAELEDTSKSGGDFESEEDLWIWEAAVEISKPEPDAPEQTWDRWYQEPVATFFAAPTTVQQVDPRPKLIARTTSSARTRAPRARRRAVRTSRAGPDDSDEPEPPSGRLAGNRANLCSTEDDVRETLERVGGRRPVVAIVCSYCGERRRGSELVLLGDDERPGWWQNHCGSPPPEPSAVQVDRHRPRERRGRGLAPELQRINEAIELAMAAASVYSANSGRRIAT